MPYRFRIIMEGGGKTDFLRFVSTLPDLHGDIHKPGCFSKVIKNYAAQRKFEELNKGSKYDAVGVKLLKNNDKKI